MRLLPRSLRESELILSAGSQLERVTIQTHLDQTKPDKSELILSVRNQLERERERERERDLPDPP